MRLGSDPEGAVRVPGVVGMLAAPRVSQKAQSSFVVEGEQFQADEDLHCRC